jgi:hypothetical protein
MQYLRLGTKHKNAAAPWINSRRPAPIRSMMSVGLRTTLEPSIRIVGHSFVATEVQFLGPPRTFNAEVFSH